MKAAFITTSTDNCNPIVGGWESFNETPAWTRYQEGASEPDDAHLLPFVKAAAPDVVFYIGAAYLPGNPRIETLQSIRKLAPFVHICFDGGDNPWWPTMAEYREAGCFSRQVNIDGANCPTADLTTLVPVDPRPYAGDYTKRRKAGFAGFTANTYRGSIINPLVQHGLVELRHRKTGYKNNDYDDFAKWLCETGITVNTAVTGTEWRRHVKGRVIEAGLAKCCLLEDDQSPTKNWFTPMVDYIPFGTPEEAAYIIKHMPEQQARTIGESLHAKIHEQYSAKTIYEAMLKELPR
jgi:hypothetical protein